ncbi:hypothetical protein GCM10027063_31330 [Promicromonospora xylanilytica]
MSPDDFASRAECDALNCPVKEFQLYDLVDARCNDGGVYSEITFDWRAALTPTGSPEPAPMRSRPGP